MRGIATKMHGKLNLCFDKIEALFSWLARILGLWFNNDALKDGDIIRNFVKEPS